MRRVTLKRTASGAIITSVGPMSILHPFRKLRRTLDDEDGAITVDWLVLTSLVIGLAVAAGVMAVEVVNSGAGIVKSQIDSQKTN